jgi:hypothetical protein
MHGDQSTLLTPCCGSGAMMLVMLAVLGSLFAAAPGCEAAGVEVVVGPDSSPLARLAAAELRRYIWHVTGQLSSVVVGGPSAAATSSSEGCQTSCITRRVVVVESSSTGWLTGSGLLDAASASRVRTISRGEAQHSILSPAGCGGTALVAGDGVGVLYAAYQFAEHALGVHFSIAGDVMPRGSHLLDPPPPLGCWGAFDEVATPRFALRGLQPFYNFAEGPDWWSSDHWRAVLTQAAKLRMNMVALHTYNPTRTIGTQEYSNTTGARAGQPQLWVGSAANVSHDGNVSKAGAYESGGTWATTSSGSFSLQSGQGTGSYPFGGSLPFATECHANPDVFGGARCNAHDSQHSGADPALFAAAAKQLRGAFSFGKRLGFKFALGSEVPVFVPGDPQLGKRATYEGVFTWLRRTGLAKLLDYYWMWTGEVWPARRAPDLPQGSAPLSHSSPWLQQPLEDFLAADAARRAMGMPFRMATGGWTMGPLNDRLFFDEKLPSDFAIGSIDVSGGACLSVVQLRFTCATPVLVSRESEDGNARPGRRGWAMPRWSRSTPRCRRGGRRGRSVGWSTTAP